MSRVWSLESLRSLEAGVWSYCGASKQPYTYGLLAQITIYIWATIPNNSIWCLESLWRLESRVTPESRGWSLQSLRSLEAGVWNHSGVWSLDSGVTPECGDWSLESLRRLEAGAAPESGGRSLELLRSIQITIHIWATSPNNYIHMGYYP